MTAQSTHAPERDRTCDDYPVDGVDQVSSQGRSAHVVERPLIHLIEDDPAIREAERGLFEAAGWEVCDYFSAENFLAAPRPSGDTCLVIDVELPGMNGPELLALLRKEGIGVPAIMLMGRNDAGTAVAALKAGATDYIEKPANWARLQSCVSDALEQARSTRAQNEVRSNARACFESLTPSERDVMLMVLEGAPNKNIAADLGINQRTVENHRAKVMRKTGAQSLPALVQLFLQANEPD